MASLCCIRYCLCDCCVDKKRVFPSRDDLKVALGQPKPSLSALLQHSNQNFSSFYLPAKEGPTARCAPLIERLRSRDCFLKTGDLLLFSTYPGESLPYDIARYGSRVVQGTHFTHIGIVVRAKAKVNGTIMDIPLVFESLPIPHDPRLISKDAISDSKERNSIWCFDLSRRVAEEYARLWHVPLRKPLSPEQVAKVEEYLVDFWFRDPAFDNSSMFWAGIDKFDDALPFLRNKPDVHEVFCSELVAAALMHAGVFPPDSNPSEETPLSVSRSEHFVPGAQNFVLKYDNEPSLLDFVPRWYQCCARVPEVD